MHADEANVYDYYHKFINVSLIFCHCSPNKCTKKRATHKLEPETFKLLSRCI